MLMIPVVALTTVFYWDTAIIMSLFTIQTPIVSFRVIIFDKYFTVTGVRGA
jgi:hypothetical protein